MTSVPQDVLNGFIDAVKTVCGDNAVSVILYGSAVTPEFDPKKSDLNFLVVLNDASVDSLRPFSDIVKRWRKKRVAVPLVLDKAYIESSLDTFPIEFLNMKAQYKVVHGEDVLAGLSFKKDDLRLQCERELKGKSLRLRQVLMEKAKGRDLVPVINDSLTAFIAVFRGLLELAGRNVPSERAGVVADVCAEYEIDKGVFDRLLRVKAGTLKLKDDDAVALFEAYAREVKALSVKVDQLTD